MATYYQESSYIEEGRGAVREVIVVSDTHAGLFVDLTTTGLPVHVFSGEPEVSEGIDNSSGGAVQRQISLQLIEAAIQSEDDIDCIEFIKEARVATNVRFLAKFIDPHTPLNLNTDLEFCGIISTNFESEDVRWYNSRWETDTNAVRVWKITASPYSKSVFQNISMDEIISKLDRAYNGTEWFGPDSYPWTSLNVSDREAYFKDTAEYYPKVDSLVSLNKLIRRLASVFANEIDYVFNIPLTITFTGTNLDGNWHPARWNSLWSDYVVQKVKNEGSHFTKNNFYVNDFTCYSDDYNTLRLDPDEVSETPAETIYISHRLITKLNNEPSLSGIAELMFNRKKHFFEFIEDLAFNFGLYIDYKWTGLNTINIEFINRADFVKTKIYLKTAIKSSEKTSVTNLEDKRKFIGKANAYACEGPDYYYEGNGNNPTGDLQQSPELRQQEEGELLLLTISPTRCVFKTLQDFTPAVSGQPHHVDFHNIGFVHNHYITDSGNLTLFKEAIGIHTAIYLYVQNYPAHSDEQFHRSAYFTPCGLLTMKIKGVDRQFKKLGDYITEISNSDIEYYLSERQIETPFYYGFSVNANGSAPTWYCLKTGALMELDGTEYTVVSIKRKSPGNVQITLHAYTRFDTINDVDGIILDATDADVPKVDVSYRDNNYLELTPCEQIYAGQIVSLKDDGTIELAEANTDHQGRIYGIAKQDAEPDEDNPGEFLPIYVQTYGRIPIPSDWDDLPIGSTLYLRDNATGSSNLSLEHLQGYVGAETLFCPIAKAVDTRTIELFSGFPNQFEHEVEYIDPG